MKGYIQVYTGSGKGKTTAALGLAIRAAGAGMKVFIGQFAKGKDYSELAALKRFEDLITVRQYGRKTFITGVADDDDIRHAEEGLREVRDVVESGDYPMVILDEANIAVFFKLFSVESLLDILDSKPDHVEIVLTGRNAHPKIIERADLVTEMTEVKHYYTDGVGARRGIEE
ncbi:cob(I)yrinic acid a,c-diamide adenosyltransferase [Candidatus Latescibacterota bacterium]